ncbi:diguanylate cyclase domain-containing protein [Maritalea sp. S77]|uniref:diguanylate cyclase domain-containing protein n=1 Tax=Maritalea sp. S77 TaxID=3415125 RepID=UPI003C7C2393
MALSNILRKFNLALGIYAISALIVLAFAFSNIYILNVAGSVANKVQWDGESHLVRNEALLQEQYGASVQSEISYWDDSVDVFYGGELDLEFVEDELQEWFWEDNFVPYVAVVDESGAPELSIFEGELMATTDAQFLIDTQRDLIDGATQRYFELRKARGDGFATFGDPVYGDTPLYVADFRVVEGQVGIVVAQAIVPDFELAIPDGNPKILLTFHALSTDLFNDISSQLGLKDFTIQPASEAPASATTLRIGGTDEIPIVASWTVAQPSQNIWNQVVPVVLAILGVVATGLGAIALLYGRVAHRVQTSEAKNRFLAQHDALTGLPNRLQFDNELDKIIAEEALDRCAILCMDLDKFKAVNDTFGHQAGDAVIRTVAQRVAAVIGEKGMAARVGGDEFIILLRDGLDEQSVMMLCDTLIESVCEDVVFDNGRAAVGASIGVAWWPDDAMTAKTVIRSADEALYRAKSNGRGQTCKAAPDQAGIAESA